MLVSNLKTNTVRMAISNLTMKKLLGWVHHFLSEACVGLFQQESYIRRCRTCTALGQFGAGQFGAGQFGADSLVRGQFGAGQFGAGTIWCWTVWCRTIWCRTVRCNGQYGAGQLGATDNLVLRCSRKGTWRHIYLSIFFYLDLHGK